MAFFLSVHLRKQVRFVYNEIQEGAIGWKGSFCLRKKMGISFYRCVTQRRLISAKKLIESGMSLESTAELVGFSDYSSFFRAFKQEYGISPRQYKKMQNT